MTLQCLGSLPEASVLRRNFDTQKQCLVIDWLNNKLHNRGHFCLSDVHTVPAVTCNDIINGLVSKASIELVLFPQLSFQKILFQVIFIDMGNSYDPVFTLYIFNLFLSVHPTISNLFLMTDVQTHQHPLLRPVSH